MKQKMSGSILKVLKRAQKIIMRVERPLKYFLQKPVPVDNYLYANRKIKLQEPKLKAVPQ